MDLLMIYDPALQVLDLADATPGGDLRTVTNAAAEPHQLALLLLASPGDLRHAPLTGVGMLRYRQSSVEAAQIEASAREQLAAERFRIRRLRVSLDTDQPTIDVDATRQPD
jgi:hypothetical protein